VFQLDNPNNSVIANAQTDAKIRITSTQETYGLYLLGLSIEVWEPNLNPTLITQTAGNNPANAGDAVGFNINIQNSGNDNALGVIFSTILPPQISFLSADNLPSGVTYTYNAATGELNFIIEDGLVDVGDPEINVGFEVQINDACYFLEDNCNLDLAIQFSAMYTGTLNSNHFYSRHKSTRSRLVN